MLKLNTVCVAAVVLVSACLCLAFPFESSSGQVRRAIAIVKGELKGSPISGTVEFRQMDQSPLQIKVDISGVPCGSGSLHGLHIHTNGVTVVSDETFAICGSTGPHFNPTGSNHGDLSDSVRHVGDYGNVQCDKDGRIFAVIHDPVSQLYGPHGIVGRTVVLHQLEDDLGKGLSKESPLNGNAGARIACGVVGVIGN